MLFGHANLQYSKRRYNGLVKQSKFRVGLIQMACSVDPNENLAKVEWRIRDAAAKGAQIESLLDMPRRAPGLDHLQDEFDVVVAQAGGRVYLSKDARVAPDTLAAMYPRLQEWRAVRDRVDPERLWRSDLALRTGLLG